MWGDVVAENILFLYLGFPWLCGYHCRILGLWHRYRYHLYSRLFVYVNLFRCIVIKVISLILSPLNPPTPPPGGCSHARATAYWVESLRARNAEEMFRAWPCSDWDTFFTGGCPDCASGCLDMGFPAEQG